MSYPIAEQLVLEAEYAQLTRSEDSLLETYGKAQMALQLKAITSSEFLGIHRMTIYYLNERIRKLPKEGGT